MGTVGCGAWPSSRPAWTWQANALLSCMLTFGSAKSAVRSLALPPTTLPGESPVEREADLVDHAPLDDKGPQPPRHHRTGLDSTARRLDRHPAAVNNTALGGQLVAQLGEHLRLQFVKPAIEAAHRSTQVMLGETERRGHHGILGCRRVGDVVQRSFEKAYRRVGIVFGIEQVAQRRLDRLVMRRKRPVLDAGGVQPAQSVGLGDEGLCAGDGGHARRAWRRLVIGRLVQLEVRFVESDPAPLLGVPPDQFLAFRPGPPLGVGRGAVVQDADIVRPGEAPFRLEWVIRDLAFVRPVAARLGEDAAVDPAAACRRAVVLQLRVAAHQTRPPGARVGFIQPVTVDLHEDLLQVRFPFNAAERSIGQTRLLVEVVVPGEVQQRLVLGIGRAGVELLEALTQVVEKPGVGTAIAGRIDGFLVPLDQPLRVG